MGSFSIWHWLIVLVIFLLILGTKKLRNVGQDLGGAVNVFKDGMMVASSDGKPADAAAAQPAQTTQQVGGGQTIEGEVKEKTRS